jgi:hypothetical protein
MIQLPAIIGMLTQEELLAFTGPPNESVQLSRTAVRRIFEENINYSPMEMDYKVGEAMQGNDKFRSMTPTST